MIDAAEVESTVALPLATAPGVRNRALTTQYKLDQVWQIETQRTVVASCRRLDITYLLCGAAGEAARAAAAEAQAETKWLDGSERRELWWKWWAEDD